jgi:hypothetical protein
LLSKTDSEKILQFVKKEPCTIQDLSLHIGKSWVTTESYVEQIAKETGMIRTKKFRGGTKGAVKIVYWNYTESVQVDEIRNKLFDKIKLSYDKKTFDPLEVFQFVPAGKGKAFMETYDATHPSTKKSLLNFLRRVEEELLVFSGNLSFLRHSEPKQAFQEMLGRGVRVKILCRMDLGTVENLKIIQGIFRDFEPQVEIRHSLQPVRGFVADGKMIRLKDEKKKSDFKERELPHDVRVFYEIYDPDWVNWFENVFWYLFRTSIPYQDRMTVLNHFQFECGC